MEKNMKLNRIELYEKTSWLLYQRLSFSLEIPQTIRVRVYNLLNIDLSNVSLSYDNGWEEQL